MRLIDGKSVTVAYVYLTSILFSHEHVLLYRRRDATLRHVHMPL